MPTKTELGQGPNSASRLIAPAGRPTSASTQTQGLEGQGLRDGLIWDAAQLNILALEKTCMAHSPNAKRTLEKAILLFP